MPGPASTMPGFREQDWENSVLFDGVHGERRAKSKPTKMKKENRCPRCGATMDRVYDKGTICWDQLLDR